MVAKVLPSRLNKEPLIDVVCEIRFSSSLSFSDVLPGLLMAKFPGEISKIERLPIASIPAQLRDQDPNLTQQPLLRLVWRDFLVLAGNRTLGVACKLPYPGWIAFKNAVMDMVLSIDHELFHQIDRYSMKYVDLIEGADTRELIKQVNINLTVGNYQLEAENFLVRLEIPEEPHIHIVQLTAPATTQFQDGSHKSGMIVDVDSICNCSTTDISAFFESFSDRLERMHTANKNIFFSCLTEEAIKCLDPVYE